MELANVKMQDINDIASINDDTVTFNHKGDEMVLLHRDGPRFVLILNDTFTEDREASPEESKLIERIFNVAELAVELA